MVNVLVKGRRYRRAVRNVKFVQVSPLILDRETGQWFSLFTHRGVVRVNGRNYTVENQSKQIYANKRTRTVAGEWKTVR